MTWVLRCFRNYGQWSFRCTKVTNQQIFKTAKSAETPVAKCIIAATLWWVHAATAALMVASVGEEEEGKED